MNPVETIALFVASGANKNNWYRFAMMWAAQIVDIAAPRCRRRRNPPDY